MSKILFVSSSLSYGGAEKMLCFVANGLAAHGNQVTVINLMEHPDNAGRLNEGIKVIQLQPQKTRYLNRVDQVLRLIKTIKQNKPDIIISFKFAPNYFAAFAGKVLKIPVIISERCDPFKEYIMTNRVKLYLKIINSADGGVFQTKGAMQFYSEGMQKRGKVIPNPAILNENISHTVRKNGESGVIVSVARLSNVQKRYDIMLKAFREFSRNHPEYSLKIFGDGEDADNIRTWISEYELDHVVFLEGRTDYPLHAMDDADIFLTTSDYEGISNSLLEAMAIGMPVVATDCSPGGAKMLIRDGENGLLVPCGNPTAISSALGRMAEDDLLRRRCGEQARKVRDEYSSEQIIAMWIDYINKTIEKKGQKPD